MLICNKDIRIQFKKCNKKYFHYDFVTYVLYEIEVCHTLTLNKGTNEDVCMCVCIEAEAKCR